ncbi:EAL domain-containing protein [Porticoccaceae bacterium]|nr:EAL domain-containing protein [Porticoccaceae bacterium]MDC0003235.1 EAL domain-containing protein [Porticoccaceae bacterium]
MREKNHLYKKVLDTAPFGTLFFAYGVCIDVNAKALRLLRCERSQIIGTSLGGESDKNHQASITQLVQVINKLETDQLPGILWRSENTAEDDEIVVSLGAVEEADNVLCIMLYPLPALARMVVEEFTAEDLERIDTSTERKEIPNLVESPKTPYRPEPVINIDQDNSPEPTKSPEPINSPELIKSPEPDTIKSPPPTTETLAGLPIGKPLLKSINDYIDLDRDDNACGALLLIDLDHFNSINESLGKHIGAQILERAHESIQAMLTDNMQVTQVAGDAFLLFIKDIAPSPAEARECALSVANEIRCIIARPFFTENGEVIVTASVGITLLYDSLISAEKAIQQAESAMFEAKRRGRDTVTLFDTQITRQAQQRITLQSSLRKAVVNQEFDLYLQPQVSTHTGAVVGGEVLLRWIHSGHAMHTPADFIPILEASGMIVDVGLWVIRTSCEYLRNMLDSGIWTPDMQLGVNISPKQFHDPGLISSLEHSLKSYDINPEMITLEVTENLLIDDFESVVDKMKKIRNMGTKFSIDDFGSGYSSMIYLKRLPLDGLKIDREFISNLNTDKDTLGLVEAIMMVSRHYGLDVIAEGVEKREVLEVLRSLGCDKYQGAHFSMPVCLDKFQQLLVA